MPAAAPGKAARPRLHVKLAGQRTMRSVSAESDRVQRDGGEGAAVNAACRTRATATEMRERYAILQAIAVERAPCTVRQVFYQAVVRGHVEKSESEYEYERASAASSAASTSSMSCSSYSSASR